ncbi:MAG: methyltransferase [Mycobacterium sp.]
MVPPPVGILDAAMGGVATAQTIYAAARLGIADVLSDGPLTAEVIAARVGADPAATHRLLRALAMQSIFVHRTDGTFELTATAQTLRSDTPMSVRPLLLLLSHPLYWEHWGRLTDSVRTGRSSIETSYGMTLFECLGHEPEVAKVFNDAMSCTSSLVIPPILAAYDFSRARSIVDVGGGNGRLLSAILKAAPEARGVLFDIPSTEAKSREHLVAAGVGHRSDVEVGSFFDTVPPSGDLYVLKHIIHDWDDDHARMILGRIRETMAPTATLLLIEAVLPSNNKPHLSKFLDLDMLIFAGGHERTRPQYDTLLDTAGFRVNRAIPTASHLSIIEAVLR